MKHFKLGEFLRSDTARRNGIDMTPTPEAEANLRALVEHVLDPLRVRLGRPVIVTSGYRPPALNPLVGGSSTSQHTLGQAADIQVPGMTPDQVCEAIIRAGLPYDQLIDEFSSWVHVSYGPRHRRQFLRARKSNGRTVYLTGLE